MATLVLSISAPAFAAPPRRQPVRPVSDQQQGAVLASCDGLASPVKHKNMGRNVPARKKESNEFCGDPQKHVLAGKVGQHLKRIVDAARKCEGALKKTVSPNFSLENLVKKPTDRLLKACVQTRFYNASSEKICTTYGQNAERAKGIGGVAIDEVRGRGAFETIAKMHDPLVLNYKKLSDDAASEAKDIDQRVPGIADNKDKVMAEEIKFLKGAIKFNVDKAKQLVAAKLNDRRQLSGEASGFAEMGTVRFRNCRRGESEAACRADPTSVGGFYAALDSCNAIAKDGGLLDKWNEDYDKVISKELTEMKTEAKALASHFSDISSDHQRQAAQIRSRATGMDTTAIAAGANGDATKRDQLTPAQLQRAITDGQGWTPGRGETMDAYLARKGMVNSGRFTGADGKEYVIFRRGPQFLGMGAATIAVPASRVR